jgi:hypothetical protein
MTLHQLGLQRRREFDFRTLMTSSLVGEAISEATSIVTQGTSSIERGFRNAKKTTALLPRRVEKRCVYYDPPGRFLKRDDRTHECRWIEVGDLKTMERMRLALLVEQDSTQTLATHSVKSKDEPGEHEEIERTEAEPHIDETTPARLDDLCNAENQASQSSTEHAEMEKTRYALGRRSTKTAVACCEELGETEPRGVEEFERPEKRFRFDDKREPESPIDETTSARLEDDICNVDEQVRYPSHEHAETEYGIASVGSRETVQNRTLHHHGVLFGRRGMSNNHS